MAAGIEYQLLSKILELQDFHTVQKLKIDESFFFSPECKQLFKYLHDHFHAKATFGQIPDWHLATSIHRSFPYTPSNNSIETLCNQLRLAKMRVELLGIADTITQMADTNPVEAMGKLRECAANMATRHEVNDDMTLADAYDKLLSDYHLVAQGQGLTGLPWPWEILNDETQGIHKGEFIVIYGRPKNMKTWCGLSVAVYINQYANARVLVYSLEMPPIQILRRVAALRTKVDYKHFKSGNLQTLEYQRVFQELANLKGEATNATDKHNTFMVCGTSGDGGGGVSFLHSKIREFKPDLVVVDGMYLMRDDRQKQRTVDWKAIAHISQDLKRTAQEFDVPVLGITQANRKADKSHKNADLAEIAYADALAQDCDLAIRVQKRINKETGLPELILALPGMREGDLDAFMIHATPAVDFSFKSAVVSADEDDGGGHQGGGGHRKGGDSHNGASRTVPVIDPNRNRKMPT